MYCCGLANSFGNFHFVSVMRYLSIVLFFVITISCQSQKQEYDIIIREGAIYDGLGQKSFIGDVAIKADTIAAIGDLSNAIGKKEIDAKGLVISPGFINM